jgi:hypothetical protein
MELISVESPKDFPNAPVFGFRGKSIEDVKRWAVQHKSETVLCYRHKFGNEMYTAVRLVVDASKDIEQAGFPVLSGGDRRVAGGAADLSRMAEARLL